MGMGLWPSKHQEIGSLRSRGIRSLRRAGKRGQGREAKGLCSCFAQDHIAAASALRFLLGSGFFSCFIAVPGCEHAGPFGGSVRVWDFDVPCSGQGPWKPLGHLEHQEVQMMPTFLSSAAGRLLRQSLHGGFCAGPGHVLSSARLCAEVAAGEDLLGQSLCNISASQEKSGMRGQLYSPPPPQGHVKAQGNGESPLQGWLRQVCLG